MTIETLDERKQVFTEALAVLKQQAMFDDEKALLTHALSDVRVRDALLKSFTDSELEKSGDTSPVTVAIAIDTLRHRFGDNEADYPVNVLATLAGLSAIDSEPEESIRYAKLGLAHTDYQLGKSLCALLMRAFTYIDHSKACEIFTESIDALTLEDTLQGA